MFLVPFLMDICCWLSNYIVLTVGHVFSFPVLFECLLHVLHVRFDIETL